MRVFPGARILLALLLALILIAVPAHADTLVENVNGVTLDEKGEVKTFAALLFGGDGRVKALYQGKDKRPRAQYQIDGKGRTMLPGLIDAHLHVMAVGFGALSLDLSATRSLAEAQAKIAAYAAAHPDRAWILGRGWNQEPWGLGRFPTAAELDAAVAGRPVWLQRVDGHAGWANSTALAAAAVTAATADPAGGRIERLTGGRPAGVLVDNAARLIERVVPPGSRRWSRSPAPSPARGSTTTGCAWLGSSCTSTARSARAAPGSRRTTPTIQATAG